MARLRLLPAGSLGRDGRRRPGNLDATGWTLFGPSGNVPRARVPAAARSMHARYSHRPGAAVAWA